MFIFLSKILPPFVYPMGLACIFIVLALFLTRKAGLQRAALIIALLSLWIGGNRWVAMGLARSLEWRYLPPGQVPGAEVIVLLGGGTLPAEDPRPMVEVNSAGDRLLYAAWLYQQGKADHILLSGGVLDWVSRESTPAQEMAVLMGLIGIPPEALWLESGSRNTYENALNCAMMLEARGIKRILLVTSASHMPRSVLVFEAQGLEVIPLPTDFTVTQANWLELRRGDFRAKMLGLIPSAENLALTTRFLKEYIGLIVYELRGWG